MELIDKKKGVICLVIIFPPRIMVIKMWKMASLVFSADDSKNLVTFWAK